MRRKMHPLYGKFPPEETSRILNQPYCELEADFPGFVRQYAGLARIIPRHFVVIDFGCYLAAQCWYFRRHKAYIGVDLTELERFRMPNTTHYTGDISEWIESHRSELPPATFAISNYVGGTPRDRVREEFPHVFCFYPERKPERA